VSKEFSGEVGFRPWSSTGMDNPGGRLPRRSGPLPA
jgi:hypothetical protein